MMQIDRFLVTPNVMKRCFIGNLQNYSFKSIQIPEIHINLLIFAEIWIFNWCLLSSRGSVPAKEASPKTWISNFGFQLDN